MILWSRFRELKVGKSREIFKAKEELPTTKTKKIENHILNFKLVFYSRHHVFCQAFAYSQQGEGPFCIVTVLLWAFFTHEADFIKHSKVRDITTLD
jgi:hypothetical protein